MGVGGFSVMDNHLHLLVRLDPELAAELWSDDEVVRRLGTPLDDLGTNRDSRCPISEDGVRGQTRRHPRVAKTPRASAKYQLVHEMPEGTHFTAGQPRKTKCRGAFFEARFKSVAILDEEAFRRRPVRVD